MGGGVLALGVMQAELGQLRRDGEQEGWSTPGKILSCLFPINKGCSTRDGGGDGAVALEREGGDGKQR